MLKCLLSLLLISATLLNVEAQVPLGSSLVTHDLSPLKADATGAASSTIERVAIKEQPFASAYRITSGNTGFTLKSRIDSSVRKGDVLLLSFYTRALQSRRETGESFMEVRLDRFPNGTYEWPPLLERGMSFGSQWTHTQIPFTASRDGKPGELVLTIKCGNTQVFDLGAITLLNYRQSASVADLPRSVVHYQGDAPDAAWRKAAAERIEKYRKGNLTIQITDKNGKPVPNADVSVRLKKHDFAWGTSTSTQRLLDTLDPNSATYRDILLKNFNTVVLENELKAKYWDKYDHTQTLKGLTWLKAHSLPVRGHVMVWPSWQHSPQVAHLKNDTAALRAAIMNRIDEQTTVMNGQFVEWDVVNEPYAHHDIIDLLGRNVLVDWFKAAHTKVPGVKLFLNDYTMFQGEGPGSASERFYENVKFLQEKGAPIDAIGEQGHIGGTPPGIEYVLARLDHFAELGLPIQISEFDITSDNDDFKARYLNDFMTALYSHPATIGIIQWGFWAGQHWIPAAALWDKNWSIRPHGKVYSDLIHKTWHTQAAGHTDNQGVYNTRGFTGDYEVVVTYKSKNNTKQINLKRDGQIFYVKIVD